MQRRPSGFSISSGANSVLEAKTPGDGSLIPPSAFRLPPSAFPLLIALTFLLGTVSRSLSQPLVSTEYDIKAALVLRLTQFVEWPTSAFGNSTNPIVIGVLGENPFAGGLEKVLAGETVQGRPLVRRLCKTLAETENCHMLFIPRSESARLDRILKQLQGKPILTVSDIDLFAERGGMVQFITERKHVKPRINLAEIEATHLKISSKLARIAERVSTQK